MATNDIAAKWLRENTPPKRREVVLPKNVRELRAVPAAIFHPYERVAIQERNLAEVVNLAKSKPRLQVGRLPKRARRRCSLYSTVDEAPEAAPKPEPQRLPSLGLEFIKENVGFSGQQCLLMPRSTGYTPYTVTLNGNVMQAARAMLILTKGLPKFEGAVARHLCGKGHLSCINPGHLDWGTTQDNANDRVLHTSRPKAMPPLTQDQIDEIRSSPVYPPVLAIHMNIPLAIIELVQRG